MQIMKCFEGFCISFFGSHEDLREEGEPDREVTTSSSNLLDNLLAGARTQVGTHLADTNTCILLAYTCS